MGRLSAVSLVAVLSATCLLGATPAAGDASWHPHKYSRKHGDQFTKKREQIAKVNAPMPNHGKLRGGPPTPMAISEEEAEEVALMLQPDLFSRLPAGYMDDYKNPCWMNATTEPPSMHCLPYYYILGNFQCGVRDLQNRLQAHPSIIGDVNTAPHWWDEDKPFDQYQQNYDRIVDKVKQNKHKIVGDASTATFAYTWAGSGRSNHPWSEAFMDCYKNHCKEDRACIARECYSRAKAIIPPLSGGGVGMTVPYLMRRAMGRNIRLIVMLRDPVDRLHAAFWAGDHYQKRYGATEEGFVEFARDSMQEWHRCLREFTEKECVFAYEALSMKNEDVFFHCDQLIKSLYVPFVEGWVDAFHRNDILFLRLEDYIKDTPGTLRTVLQHLDLDHQDQAMIDKMLAMPITRGSRDHASTPNRGKMLPEIRKELKAFYEPYNRRLANAIGRERFTWSDTDT